MFESIDERAEIYEHSEHKEEFDINSSKLFWKNRLKKPQRKIETYNELKDEKNEVILDPKIFNQKFHNYLGIDIVYKYSTEKQVLSVYFKVLEAISNPLNDSFLRKKLLYNCRKLLRVFSNPVFSGAVNPLINQLDLKYA